MADLVVACSGVRPEPCAAAPTLLFRLRVEERSGLDVRAVALRCQLRVQPHRRVYSRLEQARLAVLFGTPDRWAATQRPLQLATVTVMVPGFRGSTEIDVPVPCSYDLEVSCGQYFHALEGGQVPVLMLFSGTVFSAGQVEMVPWDQECTTELPAAVWREVMDLYFPGSGWLRLRRETLDALQKFKHERQLTTWEETVKTLLDRVGTSPVDGGGAEDGEGRGGEGGHGSGDGEGQGDGGGTRGSRGEGR
ncbi:DUF6084 family protein [Streptomyces chrestomyceticus]|uniref:DUF6084 family protein n=1 Tax=Streptomyces chrestomyceticus TaxID=68185 RepID=UPI0019D2295B|nr:DUF6084 family protein [Streptomyces chrestomyceticus]